MEALRLRWPIWIGVVCDDVSKQRRFYRDMLGMRELEAGDDWVWLDFGAGRLLELIQKSDDRQYQGVGYQIGFEVDDIHTTREELVRRGIEVVTGIEGGEEATEYGAISRTLRGICSRSPRSCHRLALPPRSADPGLRRDDRKSGIRSRRQATPPDELVATEGVSAG